MKLGGFAGLYVGLLAVLAIAVPVPGEDSSISVDVPKPLDGRVRCLTLTYDPPDATYGLHDTVQLWLEGPYRMHGVTRYRATGRSNDCSNDFPDDGLWRTAGLDSIDVGWHHTRAVRLSLQGGTTVGRVLPSHTWRQSLFAAVFAPDREIRVIAIAIPCVPAGSADRAAPASR